MINREKALIRLTQQKVSKILRISDNLGMGELGQGIREILEGDRSFGFACFDGLELAASAYNSLEITPENENFLIASAKLKKKVPQLPSPSEIFKDIYQHKQDSQWTANFIQSLDSLRSKISQGKLKWYKEKTNREALAAGGVTHEYEEKVLIDANSKGSQEFEIDEVVDVIMEMLMWKHRDTQLFSWICSRISLGQEGGMGWADGYDHISVKLRKQAGFL